MKALEPEPRHKWRKADGAYALQLFTVNGMIANYTCRTKLSLPEGDANATVSSSACRAPASTRTKSRTWFDLSALSDALYLLGKEPAF